MSKIYLFDVDGTLTPPKQKIDPIFSEDFLSWTKDKEVYIVSGGSFLRIVDQLGMPIVNNMQGIFACMGNVFYQRREQVNPSGMEEWETIYENNFGFPKRLTEKLRQNVDASPFPDKAEPHWEQRPGMLNYSVIGCNAPQSVREKYVAYDLESQERVRIVRRLARRYPELDFVIGGAVSIDIFNKGNDKSQVIPRYFEEALEHNQIHFVGDRIPSPGNDHALAESLRTHKNGYAYEVETWKDTAELLKTDPFA